MHHTHVSPFVVSGWQTDMCLTVKQELLICVNHSSTLFKAQSCKIVNCCKIISKEASASYAIQCSS